MSHEYRWKIAGRLGWIAIAVLSFLLGQKLVADRLMEDQEVRQKAILECQIRITDYLMRIHHHVNPKHNAFDGVDGSGNRFCPECYDLARRHHESSLPAVTEEDWNNLMHEMRKPLP